MLLGADIFFPHEPVAEEAFAIKRAKVITRNAIERFIADNTDAGTWLGNTPDEQEIKAILERKQIQIVDAPVVIGSMLPNVRPVAYDSARTIVRRPALDGYLRECGA